ncbi:CRE-HPR-17 protein [Caenorhabditis remanei]|uniref:CRE-HPR-17 protein n=1 Tax=Caenorhabditis remanei TaxID=31234 RepID=E3LF16_CAERE|nr:CRE-HPR-17 protein [Caenorhabditis remanei]
MNDNDLLTNETAPKRRDELQIHNKKLGEVSNWLKSAFSEDHSAPGVLYLTGPTGSGKSTSVEVLCKEKNIELIDYTPELLHDDFLEYEKHDFSQLIRFLIRRHASLMGGSKKQILFVTELPDQSYQDAERFREEMYEALHRIRHPVIFCLTNDIACWNLNPDKLFTREFIRKADISTITFNPVADTFMKKALIRASNLLPSPLSDTKLNIIKEEARGDLRTAMNMLQMNSVGLNANRRTGMKVICASKANKEEAFHMLGRILYAKRVNPNAPKLTRFSQKRRSSVPIPEPTERTDLENDPSDIITMSSMSSGKLVDFLFENEPVFCPSISNYRRVVDMFSLCDVLAGDWNTARSFPDEYAAQIATRSVMWNNFQGSRPKTMFCIARPTEKDLEKQMTATRNEIRRLPMIGNKHFSSLDAPYRGIIENITDPQRIELFLGRPMEIGWKLGKDRIEELIDGRHYIAYKGRKHPRKARKNATPLVVKQAEEEDETYTIEDSSDDSFDEF